MIQRIKRETILFRLFRWILSILLILCIVIYFIIQGIKSYCGFHRLDNDSIECIMIYKFDANSLHHRKDSLVLSKSRLNSFVRKWNNSYPVGLYKYIPSFTLSAKLKNGQIRNFRTCSGIVKEDNDYGFRFLCEEKFFESTWNEK
jgi:hypothetical protein